jgi:hypothetical protein
MKIVSSILLHGIALNLLLPLNSCGLVHKVFNKTKSQTDTQVQKNTDSLAVKKKDSTTFSIEDSSYLKKKETLNQNEVEIHFTDSSDTNSIEITTDDKGKQTIQAKGHIRSVTTLHSHAAQRQDSSHYQKQNQTSHQMLDSTKATTQTQASLHQNIQTTTKEKKSSRLPWYSYTLLLFLLLLFLYLRFRNKIKDFFKL